jgi:hypothetical protein
LTDHAQEIRQLQAKKANLKVAKEAQKQQLKKEKEAAIKQAKEEIEENKKAKPPSPQSTKPPQNSQPTSIHLRKESSTSLLQGVLGRAAAPKSTSSQTPSPPPTRRPSVLSEATLLLSPLEGTKRARPPSEGVEASEAKRQKTLKTAEERAVAAVVATLQSQF